ARHVARLADPRDLPVRAGDEQLQTHQRIPHAGLRPAGTPEPRQRRREDRLRAHHDRGRAGQPAHGRRPPESGLRRPGRPHDGGGRGARLAGARQPLARLPGRARRGPGGHRRGQGEDEDRRRGPGVERGPQTAPADRRGVPLRGRVVRLAFADDSVRGAGARPVTGAGGRADAAERHRLPAGRLPRRAAGRAVRAAAGHGHRDAGLRAGRAPRGRRPDSGGHRRGPLPGRRRRRRLRDQRGRRAVEPGPVQPRPRHLHRPLHGRLGRRRHRRTGPRRPGGRPHGLAPDAAPHRRPDRNLDPAGPPDRPPPPPDRGHPMTPTLLITTDYLAPGDEVDRLLREAGYATRHRPLRGTREPGELVAILDGCVGALIANEPMTAEVFARAPELRAVVRTGVGYDSVDVEAATKAGVSVSNLPGVNANAVAEYTMALLLAQARRLVTVAAEVRAGGWPREDGHELRGKTLGLLGYGATARAVVPLARAFGLTVLCTTGVPEGGRGDVPVRFV